MELKSKGFAIRDFVFELNADAAILLCYLGVRTVLVIFLREKWGISYRLLVILELYFVLTLCDGFILLVQDIL